MDLLDVLITFLRGNCFISYCEVFVSRTMVYSFYIFESSTTGGHLVVLGFAVDDQGQFIGSTKRVKLCMRDTMTSLWSGMAADGKITHVCMALIVGSCPHDPFKTNRNYKIQYRSHTTILHFIRNIFDVRNSRMVRNLGVYYYTQSSMHL